MFSQSIRACILLVMSFVPGAARIWPLGQAVLTDSASMYLGPTSGAQISMAPAVDAFGCVAPTAQKPAINTGDAVPNQFIVHLVPGVDRATHMTKVQGFIAEGVKCDGIISVITLDGPIFADLAMYGGIFGPSVLAALKKLADVKTIIANTLVELDSPVHAGASVDNATTQGIFFDTTQTNTWNLARLNTGTEMVDEVIDDRDKSGALRDQNTRNWPFRNFRNAGKNVNVYLIDTGVSDHNDLAGRIVRKRNANVTPGAPPAQRDDTTDTNGHGTKLAGVIAGQTVGVAKYANIIPIKAANDAQITQMGIMAGIAFAVADSTGQPAVINLSITMRKNLGDGLPEIIQLAIKNGLHVVNSAGNGGVNDCANRIGTTDGPITVANCGYDNTMPLSSNWGPCVTVFAPGNDIVSTAHNNPVGFLVGHGTSEATAHTSGLVATLLSDGDYTPEQMKARVLSLSVLIPTIDAPGTTKRFIQVPKPLIG
ncbi:peptidase S8/S53 domain-containing protein [Mycena leptocephala]|nr:peptidase S8/S53 domain-containing protein [Mycena leptocephala]